MTFASPLLTRTAIAFAFLFLAVYALTFLDARLLYGVSLWEKPSKFFLSLAIHMATLAWGISLLPAEQQRSRGIRLASLAFLAAAVFEMAYMTYQSSLGEASHFNLSTPFNQMMYNLMGFGALTLTGTTGYIGWRISRAGTTPMHFAAGWSFIVSAFATTLVAGYLAQGQGHWIGGDQTDATGLSFFHWSTTGGDLRVAHFAALHIIQAVPLITWFWPDKRIATAALIAGVAIVGGLSAQALMGLPLFRI
ncbi:MAG: hypothetical protein Q8L53_02500 [Aestuariivirga sp.]|nr:hypothetical protein [Aestuariivirga sp.]